MYFLRAHCSFNLLARGILVYQDVPKNYGPHLFPKQGSDGQQEFHYWLMVKFPKMWETEYKAPLLHKDNGRMIWHPVGFTEEIVFHVSPCMAVHCAM